MDAAPVRDAASKVDVDAGLVDATTTSGSLSDARVPITTGSLRGAIRLIGMHANRGDIKITAVGPGRMRRAAALDARNLYELDGLPPGRYQVSIEFDADVKGYASPVPVGSARTVHVVAGKPTQLDFTINAPPPPPMVAPYGAPAARRRTI
jgi:hypothetical protein